MIFDANFIEAQKSILNCLLFIKNICENKFFFVLKSFFGHLFPYYKVLDGNTKKLTNKPIPYEGCFYIFQTTFLVEKILQKICRKFWKISKRILKRKDLHTTIHHIY